LAIYSIVVIISFCLLEFNHSVNAVTQSVPNRRIAISAEDRQRARRFSHMAENADLEVLEAVKAIFLPLRARSLRNPRPRYELLADAARQWTQAVPRVMQLEPPNIKLTKRPLSLIITDVRLISGNLNFSKWQAGVQAMGIGICVCGLSVSQNVCQIQAAMIAVATEHSIGRFYQRSFQRDDSALMDALQSFARGVGGAFNQYFEANDPSFEIPARDGAWHGTVADVSSLYDNQSSLCAVAETFY
jgi:hypothetical protein